MKRLHRGSQLVHMTQLGIYNTCAGLNTSILVWTALPDGSNTARAHVYGRTDSSKISHKRYVRDHVQRACTSPATNPHTTSATTMDHATQTYVKVTTMRCTGVATTAQNARLAHCQTTDEVRITARRGLAHRLETRSDTAQAHHIHTRHSTYTWGCGGNENPHISLDLLLQLQLKTLLPGVLTDTAHGNGCCGLTATIHCTRGWAIVASFRRRRALS